MSYRKKLIEVALPLEEINEASAREKSIRHGHPSTLHLWWARRPLATCRAVLFSSIIDDPGEEGVPQELLDQIDALPLHHKYRHLADEEPTLAEGESLTTEQVEWEKLARKRRYKLFTFIERLVQWENSNDPETLKIARNLIRAATGGNPPPVLDPFCGGGSIPLEAQRLGLEAHGSDLNPVAVLITKAMIEIPPKFADQPPINPEARSNHLKTWTGAQGLAEDVRYYGQWMRDEAERRIGHLYPKVKAYRDPSTGAYYSQDDVDRMWIEENRLIEPKESFFPHPSKLVEEELTAVAWLWTRTVPSPDPAAKGTPIPLVRSFVLSNRKGKESWVQCLADKGSMSYRFVVKNAPFGEAATGTMNRQGGTCILTGAAISYKWLRATAKKVGLGTRLLAVVCEGPRGRIFLSPTANVESAARKAEPRWKPVGNINHWPGRTNVVEYGMTEFGDLFTDRQLVNLTTFSELIKDVGRKIVDDQKDLPSRRSSEYSAVIQTYLAFALDKMADYHSSIATWASSGGFIRGTFARQAIPMTWDFAECNPFSDSTGNWMACIDWVWKAVSNLPTTGEGVSEQVDATKQTKHSFLFSTDPPYFDNIGYADLSDFFYIWLRRSLEKDYPGLFSTVVTPKADELIATPHRHGGSRAKATEFFEKGLHQVFERIRQQGLANYPTTVYYAFKQSESEEGDAHGDSEVASTGWESMLQGLVDSGFSVNGTWPTRTERPGRTIGIGANALASCIVLVCRPRQAEAETINRRQFVSLLTQELRPALGKLTQGNLAPVDLAQAAIGPGMAVFSRYAAVLEADGQPMEVRKALEEINRALAKVLEEQDGWYDPQTRFAVTWFDQRGFQEGPYGEAETLAVAKDAPVSTLADAGIARSGGGKVKLFTREELDPSYDPATDKRTTIWEATQYLVRELDQFGELGAARMMRRYREAKPDLDIDRARELAYRLYAICDQKKMTQEARGYNALVLSWSDIEAVSQTEEAIWNAVVTTSSTGKKRVHTAPTLEGLDEE